jgi:hypothetical protein
MGREETYNFVTEKNFPACLGTANPNGQVIPLDKIPKGQVILANGNKVAIISKDLLPASGITDFIPASPEVSQIEIAFNGSIKFIQDEMKEILQHHPGLKCLGWIKTDNQNMTIKLHNIPEDIEAIYAIIYDIISDELDAPLISNLQSSSSTTH